MASSSSSSIPLNRSHNDRPTHPHPPPGPSRRSSWAQPQSHPSQASSQSQPTSSSTITAFKPQYLGRNGFNEITLPPMSESERERLALQSRRDALFVLDELGEFFPPLTKLKEHALTNPSPSTPIVPTASFSSFASTITSSTSTAASIEHTKLRIAQNKESHQRKLDKILAYFKSQMDEEVMEQYVSTEIPRDSAIKDANDQRAWDDYYKSIEQIFRHSTQNLYTSHMNFLSHYQHDYLAHVLIPLRTHLVKLKELAEAQRLEREAMFPASTEDFLRMDKSVSVAAQRRVAQYLVADKQKREEMMEQSRWAYRQTQALVNEYEASKSLKAEVSRILQATQTRDPRIRR